MNFTKGQLEDLETVEYFIPDAYKSIKIIDEDRKIFCEWSERGKHKDKIITSHFKNGFDALVEGKRWRGIHIHELYEQGILDGSMPYYVILGGYKDKKRITKWWNYWWYYLTKNLYTTNPTPRRVVNFMKKEMFKGKDAEIIEKVYQEILSLK
jgi:hypothetical protein